MIKTGGRSDVVIQWFSTEYIQSHKALFSRVTINPGEVMLVLKGGKVDEVVTETQVHLVDGLLTRIVNAAKGGSDGKQVVFVDARPKQIAVPFECYSKDRMLIKGVTSMVIRFSAPDVVRTLNLLTMPMVTDAKWPANDMGKIKEVTIEDLEDIIGHGTRTDIDCYVVSKRDSSEIVDQRIGISEEITKVMNNTTPHWSYYGVRVEHIQTEISENGYEDAMREKALLQKKHMFDDLKFNDDAKQLDIKKNLEKLVIMNQAELEVAKVVAAYDAQKQQLIGDVDLAGIERDARFKDESDTLAHEIDMSLTGAEAKNKIRKLELETSRMEDSYSAEALVKRAEAEAEAYRRQKDAEIYGKDKEQDVELKGMNEMAAVRMRMDEADTRNEISKREAEIKLEETRKSLELQLTVAASEAYTKGYNAGFEKAQRAALEFNESQARNLAAANPHNGGMMPPQSAGCANCDACRRSGMAFCSNCGRRLL